MNPIGLDYLTLLGTHPVRYLECAAAAGCSSVSLFQAQPPFAYPGAVQFSLIEDVALRRELATRAEANGVEFGLLEGFVIAPGMSVSEHRAAFDVAAELGIRRVNSLSFDAWTRTVDELGKLVELAAQYGITVTVEACPLFTIDSLRRAMALCDELQRPASLRLLIDTLHVARSGELADLAGIDPQMVDYVQICDARLQSVDREQYHDEAMHERLLPGEGEIPFREVLRNLRPDVIVSAEIPMRRRREGGMSDLARANLAAEGVLRALTGV